MWSRCSRITGQIKQLEKKLHERQEMIRQAQVYRENHDCHVQYKKTKPRKQADFAEKHQTELAPYDYAERYLLEHIGNDRKVKPEVWKAEAARLESEKDQLYGEMRGLRDEAREADDVMRSVERAIQRERPCKQVKKWDIEL